MTLRVGAMVLCLFLFEGFDLSAAVSRF
jgi:hypothetical protein